jgi:hypothetical protein
LASSSYQCLALTADHAAAMLRYIEACGGVAFRIVDNVNDGRVQLTVERFTRNDDECRWRKVRYCRHHEHGEAIIRKLLAR